MPIYVTLCVDVQVPANRRLQYTFETSTMQKTLVSVVVFILIGLLQQTATTAELPYVQHENIVYAETDGVGLLMDVFTPNGDANGLGIIDVISGAWHSDRGKIRDHARAQTFRILCGKGYTVFAIRPGSISKFSVPEMLVNLNQGVRWVKDHSNDYKIDPHRLGLMGASAGGHLACLAAVTAHDEKVGSDGGQGSSDTRVPHRGRVLSRNGFPELQRKANRRAG